MTSIQNDTAMPVEIRTFFDEAYGQEPKVTTVKRDTQYTLPGEGDLKIILDSYGGCHVVVPLVSAFTEEQASCIRQALGNLETAIRNARSRDSLWVEFELPCSIGQAAKVFPDSWVVGKPGEGNIIQDLQKNQLKVWQWLNPAKECSIPPGATHNLGATALVLDPTTQKVLLVVNERRSNSWNLPGGSFDLSLDSLVSTASTAVRETEEEAGIKISQEQRASAQLIGQLTFPFNQFAAAINQQWLIVAERLSQVQTKPREGEIKQAKWISVSKVLKSDGTLEGLELGIEIRAAVKAASDQLGWRIVEDKKWMQVYSPAKF